MGESSEAGAVLSAGRKLEVSVAVSAMLQKTPSASVGLLGGTFDPVHAGHLALAHTALAQLSLEALLFIPAACAPLRATPPVASLADRWHLLELALAETADPRLGLCNVEARDEKVHYTIDTVHELRAQWPSVRFVWLLGSDQFAQLDCWRSPQELAQLVEFAVLERPGAPPAQPPPGLAEVLRWRRLNGTAHPANSTEIRRLRKAGEPWAFWLPRSVAAAIEERNLYR
jgi:nicotinate-nucleotide adenylyltransferase